MSVSEQGSVRGVGGTKCGCRSMSEKESLVKIFSFTWDTAALGGQRRKTSAGLEGKAVGLVKKQVSTCGSLGSLGCV